MNRKTSRPAPMMLIVVAAVVTAVEAWGSPAAVLPTSTFVSDPDFWLATSTNLVGTGYFITRVHAPAAAPYLGAGTELVGIPILASSIVDLSHKKSDFSTWAGIGYATWALGAATIDHVLKVEYRSPARPAILIPYVAGYYAAIGCLSAAQYHNGYLPWAIAGGTCLLTLASSFYARAKETERAKR
ncbi:MAG TPA: hypothetical protein VMH22_10755 [bacterium]|nr:hypothetical protein [bacterium]